MGGRGCAIPKQGNKSRKKKTQEPGNMVQNREEVKEIPRMMRKGNRQDESFAAGLESKQSRLC